MPIPIPDRLPAVFHRSWMEEQVIEVLFLSMLSFFAPFFGLSLFLDVIRDVDDEEDEEDDSESHE